VEFLPNRVILAYCELDYLGRIIAGREPPASEFDRVLGSPLSHTRSAGGGSSVHIRQTLGPCRSDQGLYPWHRGLDRDQGFDPARSNRTRGSREAAR
jgi:hypothetical protein